jgi:DNA invertase Pin-like site-specific DNA recombinase
MSKKEQRSLNMKTERTGTKRSGKLSSERSKYDVKIKIRTIYCRVSTKEQTQNLCLSTQLRVCQEYCDRHGLFVNRIFVEEGESAKTKDRTKLLELLNYCRDSRGAIQHVVVFKIDRFSRQRYDHAVLAAQLLKYGVTLKSATQPISSDAAGKLMEHILSDFTQFDDVRSERTVAGMSGCSARLSWTYGKPSRPIRKTVLGGIEKQIKELEGKRQKLLEAHVYKNILDAEMYRQEDHGFLKRSR